MHSQCCNAVFLKVRLIMTSKSDIFLLLLDDEEDTAWEKITVDINEFARMGDPAFRSHFRLTKPTFEILVTELGNYLVRKRLLQRERRPFPHMLF